MILVTGARGVVGTPLCEHLTEQGIEFQTVSRAESDDARCLSWDMQQPLGSKASELFEVTTLLHCAPIWLLTPHLSALQQTKLNRLIVFSSTSVIAKRHSADPREQALVNTLAESEASLHDFCDSQGWALTILRPSMIYGYQRDQNIMHIARFIRRYRFMLLVGQASGLRQPVHADDLVAAAMAAIDNPASYGKDYNLAGKDVLTYQNMVEKVFSALLLPPRMISVPRWLFRSLLRVAALLTRFDYSPEMADRMNQDLSYDYTNATQDLGFQPQGFLNDPARDLGAG